MTATEWLNCTHPLWMLRSLDGRASDRKLRLFGCACCRRIWDWLPDVRSRTVVEVCERYADGVASESEREAAMLAARQAGPPGWGVAKKSALHAARAGLEAALSLTGAMATAGGVPRWPAARDARQRERGWQAVLLRDIMGDPFRPLPSLAPIVFVWQKGIVVKLARAIYNDRAFDHLPVLADALEEAGCTNPDILSHCRMGGEHVRGCWAVDLILGKS